MSIQFKLAGHGKGKDGNPRRAVSRDFNNVQSDHRTIMSVDAFIWACTLDVAVPKPGNVSIASPGHGMVADQFIASARAAAAPLCEPGAPVGRRIESCGSRISTATPWSSRAPTAKPRKSAGRRDRREDRDPTLLLVLRAKT